MWALDGEESWVLKKWCFWTVVLDKILESPLDCKEIRPVHPKGDQSWVFIGRTDVEAETPILWPPDCKELTHWKRPWCWERLGAGGEGDDRGWDGWMPSPTRWTWVWVDSGSWWWTGRPSVLRFMQLQSDTTEQLNWTELKGKRWGFPAGSVTKNHLADAGDPGVAGSISGLGRSPGGGNGNMLQYSCLEKPMDRGAWRAIVQGVTKSRTWLNAHTHTHTHRGRKHKMKI